MRLARLGDEATSSIVLDHEGCNILLDCPAIPTLVDCSPAILQQQEQQQHQHQHFQLRLAVSDYAASLKRRQLHAILITSSWGLIGLAHLQQQLQAQGQDLPVHTYCTEPCLHFFQQTAQELLDVQRSLQLQQQQQSRPVQVLCAPQQQQGTSVLAPLFSSDQLQSVLDAVQIVRFGQRVLLPGCFGITAEARPSGSEIGSCLWLMTCGDQRYTYLSTASSYPGPSAPLYQPALRNLDVLLLGPSCVRRQAKQQLPSPELQQQQRQQQSAPAVEPADLLPAAVSAVAAAVAQGGRVLVPVAPGEGSMLQLLGHLPAALTAATAGSAAGSAKLVYMSPAAADALATANSCCEYLEQRKLQQVLTAGTPPFPHEELTKSGQLLLLPPATSSINNKNAVNQSATAAAAAANMINPMDVDAVVEESNDDNWGPLVQQVLSMGPCVVFVPLWSFAAGPGALLASAWCSDPLNYLLLSPDTACVSTHWLQQCCQAGLIPPQQQWQWQVLQSDSLPLDTTLGPTAVDEGGSMNYAVAPLGTSRASLHWPSQARLTAQELLGALSGSEQANGSGSRGSSQARTCRVIGCQRDIDLLESECSLQRSAPAAHLKLVSMPSNSTGSSSLLWHALDLPVPLIQASLSAELADKLQLQRLRVVKQAGTAATEGAAEGAAGAEGAQGGSGAEQVEEVSVARIQALLTHKSGGWRLEPLPTGPRPEAVSAILAQQQQQQQELLWGTIDVPQLLTDLQAAGFTAHVVPQPAEVDAPALTPAATPATVIAVDSGAAEIRLSANETEVTCDNASMRQQLLQCLLSQLHKVQ